MSCTPAVGRAGASQIRQGSAGRRAPRRPDAARAACAAERVVRGVRAAAEADVRKGASAAPSNSWSLLRTSVALRVVLQRRQRRQRSVRRESGGDHGQADASGGGEGESLRGVSGERIISPSGPSGRRRERSAPTHRAASLLAAGGADHRGASLLGRHAGRRHEARELRSEGRHIWERARHASGEEEARAVGGGGARWRRLALRLCEVLCERARTISYRPTEAL